jgi:hypothetical protein
MMNGARIGSTDCPIVARVVVDGVVPGSRLQVRLEAADAVTRKLEFQRVT